ncbi:DUF3265 domain-containing protein [Vibrio vulnificus]|nr:DUF3265 domain-containing protein [Vibrio vulnificus]QKU68578.1 DUF3265 domain-containing protein [Vibrio cholerae]EGR0093411.1 DUF3265 domain-containing protein [Vibrio vulnificus]EGR0097934.1 DUF3265 domain-containing protein [Vibrio vulnificus]EGR7945012.1 DUF3265 domain-containing protein [Vibrio vulnificus]
MRCSICSVCTNVSTWWVKRQLTRRSRGIRAAWHFWYAVSFGGENGLRKLGLCGTHPLTRR